MALGIIVFGLVFVVGLVLGTKTRRPLPDRLSGRRRVLRRCS